MPPQQPDGLLDVGFQRKRFGAHSVPSGPGPVDLARNLGATAVTVKNAGVNEAIGNAISHSDLWLSR
jgi:hypothetical protein